MLSSERKLARLREAKMDPSEDIHLPAPQVRLRYGRSDMWLWRLLRDEKSGFPQPLVINKRRYWRLADLKNLGAFAGEENAEVNWSVILTLSEHPHYVVAERRCSAAMTLYVAPVHSKD